ncbi:MAG: acetyl-CoA carboxylase biotin carboxyl carrier protein [Candidatus Eiseniibacteriota bacterium]
MAARRKGGGASRRAASKAVKSGAKRSDNGKDVMLGGIGLAEIRRLIRLVQKTGIGELELTSSGRTVRIAANSASAEGLVIPARGAQGPAAPAASASAATATAPAQAPENHAAITSPMVGTFYRAPAPDADPYVEVGHIVEIGQTVCIIEAMKLMNEIESEVRGRVTRILVENAQPVEFGQRLFLVEPA